MLRLKDSFKNPYNIGDNIEFYNKYGIWVKGVIIDFKVNYYVFKAIIKCNEKNCRFHYICVCSTYLRKC
jgi:hypothetical protein